MTIQVNQNILEFDTSQLLNNYSNPKLKENQIIQATIIDKISDNKMLLFYNGKMFFAESSIPLSKGQNILAKVESSEPKLVLKLIENITNEALKAPNKELMNQLSEQNILPTKENIKVVKAFLKEHVPLKPEVLKKFLSDISKLNIKDEKNIQSALMLQKMSIPINKVTIKYFNEIKNLDFKEKINPNLKNLIDTIKNNYSRFSNENVSNIQSIIKSLENSLNEINIKDNNSSIEILNIIKKTIDFSPSSFEKKVMSELTKIFFDKDSFNKVYESIEKDIKLIKDELSLNNSYIKYDKNIQNFIKLLDNFQNNLKNISVNKLKEISSVNYSIQDIINNQIDGSLESLIQGENNLLKFVHSADELLKLDFTNKKELEDSVKFNMDKYKNIYNFYEKLKNNFSEVFHKKTLEEIFQDLESDLKNKLNLDFNKDEKNNNEFHQLIDQFDNKENLNQQNIKYFRHPYVNIPNNIKDDFLKLNEIISREMDVLNVSEKKEKVINNLKQNFMEEMKNSTENLLNNMDKEQLLNMALENNEKIIPLNLSLMMNNEMKELKLYFKKHSSKNKNGENQDSYLVFFSMELSKLGYFEINVLDLNKKLDITFFSNDKNVRNFFNENVKELKEKLNDLHLKNVNIKSLEPEKNKKQKLKIKNKNKINKIKSENIIDIIF